MKNTIVNSILLQFEFLGQKKWVGWVYRQLQMGRNIFWNRALWIFGENTHGRRCPGCLAGAFFFSSKKNTSPFKQTRILLFRGIYFWEIERLYVFVILLINHQQSHRLLA